MASMFETATRVAIREIIGNHAKESKFGYILSKEAMEALTSDIFELLQTSRSLKSAGDKFISGTGLAPTTPPARRR